MHRRVMLPLPRAIPIVWLLPLVLAALVLGSVLPVGLFSYLAARDTTARLLRDRIEQTLARAGERVAAQLDPVHLQLDQLARRVRAGTFDPRDSTELRLMLAGALSVGPQVGEIVFVGADLLAYRFPREGDGAHVEDWTGNGAARASIEEGRAVPLSTWSPPTWNAALGQPVITRRVSLQGPSGFVGMLHAVIPLLELSRQMQEVAGDLGLTPFLLAGRERVIAHPDLGRALASGAASDATPLPHLDQVGDRVLARMWAERNELGMVAPLRGAEGHWVGPWTDAHIFVYQPVGGYGPDPWLLGLHMPSEQTRRERWATIAIAIGAAGVLALALAIAVTVGRKLARPILDLAAIARRVEAFDFPKAPDLPSSRIAEINTATDALGRMMRALSWFETYLPRVLVRRLMAAGGAMPASELREVTAMFTDLEGYTKFSRGRPAGEIIDYLNGLIGRMGPIIESTGGTVDKYIGDGLLAFWGAPETQPDHARRAVEAAGAIARAVQAYNAERRAAGNDACRMRIGVHTGDAMVGNIGFPGRLNYTILGEAVNRAQWLEERGRGELGTDDVVVLLSPATHRAAEVGAGAEPCADGTAWRLKLEAPA
jgi:class 3 adenylate cyclase